MTSFFWAQESLVSFSFFFMVHIYYTCFEFCFKFVEKYIGNSWIVEKLQLLTTQHLLITPVELWDVCFIILVVHMEVAFLVWFFQFKATTTSSLPWKTKKQPTKKQTNPTTSPRSKLQYRALKTHWFKWQELLYNNFSPCVLLLIMVTICTVS